MIVGDADRTQMLLNPLKVLPVIFGLGIGASCVLSGCRLLAAPPSRAVEYPAIRFVDTEYRLTSTIDFGMGPLPGGGTVTNSGLGTSAFPTASIADDTRFVLAAPQRAVALYQTGREISETAGVVFSGKRPPKLGPPARLLTLPKAKIGSTWVELPPIILTADQTKDTITLRLDFPSEAAGKRIDVHVDSFRADWTETVVYETTAVTIPPQATLALAIGVLKPSVRRGPVVFGVEICNGTSCEALFEQTVAPDAPDQWIDRKTDLAAYAGQDRRFVFKTTHRPAAEGGIAFPVVANPTVFTRKKLGRGKPNVILLSIDTLRADKLPLYGHHENTAPFMTERFGSGGVVFEECVAAASSTSPSHMSMFTGMRPSEHGLTTGLESLPAWIVTLPEMIRNAHMETGAVTEDGWLGARHGFGRGVNSYTENKSPNIMAPVGQVDVTFDRAIEWLENHHDKHFFLFLHTFQVHDPFSPPDQYRSLFKTAHDEAVTKDSPATDHDLVAYKQEIRYTDDELKRLFETLDRLGLTSSTVFILTSDHGEAFLEHGFYGHGAHLHQEVTHVPLLMTGPGIDAGRRNRQVVGHIDLLPTILELLEIDAAYPARGRSLLSAAEGLGHDAALDGRYYYTESWSPIATLGGGRVVPFYPPGLSVRYANRKLARYGRGGAMRYEYFDLGTDPEEDADLYPVAAVTAEDLKQKLDSYRARMKNAQEELFASVMDKAEAASERQQLILDPAQEEKLRALGYINN